MKRKIICFVLIGLACSMLFAWSQIYYPRGCFQTKGVPSLDGSYLECPKCGHRWK